VHVGPLHPKGTRRITESSTTRVGDSFEEDDAPILGLVDALGCRAIYEQTRQSEWMCRFDRLMMRWGALG
jgi:hypothetical protein